MTLRQVEAGEGNITLRSLTSVAQALDRHCDIVIYDPGDCKTESSTIAVSLKFKSSRFEEWPYYLMEMVDDYRATQDPRLFLLPPVKGIDLRLTALLASTVCALCAESGQAIPAWAQNGYFLIEPWFVSGVEALKATAILESPLAFRKNNIFVQENFLTRA